jgi:hypothetical protein
VAFIERKISPFVLALGFAALACGPAFAQKAQTGDTKQVYDAIDCSQWTLNSDGTWSGGADARVGTMTFPNTLNNTMKGYVENGVDAEAALLKKCGKR